MINLNLWSSQVHQLGFFFLIGKFINLVIKCGGYGQCYKLNFLYFFYTLKMMQLAFSWYLEWFNFPRLEFSFSIIKVLAAVDAWFIICLYIKRSYCCSFVRSVCCRSCWLWRSPYCCLAVFSRYQVNLVCSLCRERFAVCSFIFYPSFLLLAHSEIVGHRCSLLCVPFVTHQLNWLEIENNWLGSWEIF